MAKSKFSVSSVIRLSKAKTAYGLIMDVRRAILDEPRRAHMGLYTEERKPENHGADAPLCGTVGCFAGWISILAGQGLVDDDSPARALLGEKVSYELGRKHGGSFYVFNAGDGDRCIDTRPGTPEHAEAVVERIDRFVEKNRAALRRRRLPSLRERRRIAEPFLYPRPGRRV